MYDEYVEGRVYMTDFNPKIKMKWYVHNFAWHFFFMHFLNVMQLIHTTNEKKKAF